MNNSGRVDELICSLPKAELHVHIEGTLEPEMVLEFAGRNGVELPFSSAEELKSQYEFADLQSFLDLYYKATAVLQTEQDFFELTWAYLQRCKQDNVVHAEIFFDPQSHTDRGIEFSVVVDGIHRALSQAAAELGISSKLIMCYLRHLPQEQAISTWHEATAYLDKIDGIGLDSSERDFPPQLFEDVFKLGLDAGLKTVAHAGEEGPAEYIREAIDLLQVSRIDHGVRITEDDSLLAEVAERQIPLTVCPLSNTRLCVYKAMTDHPVLSLLDRGLLVTVNSDDPAYFGGYVNDNYRAVAQALSASPAQIVRLVKNSFAASFLDEYRKQSWIDRVHTMQYAESAGSC